MGMGAAACHTNIITVDTIEKVIPLEYKTFISKCKEVGIDCEDVYEMSKFEQGEAEYLDFPNKGKDEKADELAISDLEGIYCALQENFTEKTGLYINVNGHSDDEGGRYDEVMGVYWEVGTITQRTPEAIAFEKKYGENCIKPVSFTIWC